MAWPVCHRCGAPTVLVDRTAEVFNRHEAVVVRSYQCSVKCGWKAVTAEKIIDDHPTSLRLRWRWHVRLIDRIAALFPVSRLTGLDGNLQA